MPGDTPEVLIVCTGNVCRSPLAEVLLRSRLGALDVRIRSAGTHALVGAPMTPETARLAKVYGADESDIAAHRARRLTEAMLDGPDLILAATRDHRREVVQLAPHRLRRTFTIREFARLAAGISDAAIRDALAVDPDPFVRMRLQRAATFVAAARGHVEPPPATDDDIIDPYRRDRATYERSAAQLVPALDRIAGVVRAALG